VGVHSKSSGLETEGGLRPMQLNFNACFWSMALGVILFFLSKDLSVLNVHYVEYCDRDNVVPQTSNPLRYNAQKVCGCPLF